MIIIASIALGVGLVAGFGVGLWLAKVARQRRLQAAEAEAEAIVLDAKDRFEEALSEAKERVADFEEELWSRNEKEVDSLESRVQAKESEYRKKRSEIDRSFFKETKELQKRAAELSEAEKRMMSRQEGCDGTRARIHEARLVLIAELARLTGEDVNAVKKRLLDDLEDSSRVESKKRANRIEDEARANAEPIAKRIIGIALNRFLRPSCTERGIGTVELAGDDQKKKLLGPDGANLRALEKACGVDLSVTEDNTVAIAGYDPVRRELTTRCLEKLLNEKKVDPAVVDRIVEKTKAGLLRKVEEDGRRVANELNCSDINIEIKKMLGSLRYRYSFAQNQYFHVAEVGWLCGLLASELGDVKRKDAKRAGLLHDVGKAMDHSVEGGHAVIGADFIQKNGEAPHIVHAVRAHHYEEQPASDLAFLVIGADAMSGGRPGARRQTVNTYNQKIEALSTIGDGFPGVSRTMIFNAGREVRVVVDAKRVNDVQSLKLCRQIADKIEDECSYPGQIKVVVVRETHAEAFAK